MMNMTKDEAKTQVEAFLEKLGSNESNVFEEKNFAKVMIDQAIMGFVFKENETLSCQSLIYRFRREPKDSVMKAIEEESKTAPTGGGEVAFDDENLTLVLQKEYTEKISDEMFYNDMKSIAEASFVWSLEVLDRVAEKAFSASNSR